MIRIQIKKDGIVGWYLDFQNQEEADAFKEIALTRGEAPWGKHERWIGPDIEGQYPEDISQAIESREVQVIDKTIIEYKLPAEYVIEQVDITQELELEKRKQAAMAAQAKGAEIIAYVTAINDSKAITIEQVQALLMDPMLQEIQQLLWVGALQTAKKLIEAYNNPFYTADEKANILAMFP